MASAQIWRNSDRNWILPCVSTIGIWTAFLGLPCTELEHRALFLSWFGMLSVMLLTAKSSLSCALHASQRAELDRVLLLRSIQKPLALQPCSPGPTWATLLSSWKVHRRKIQVLACLCDVTALVLAPWSMLRNTEFVSHWDVKGPLLPRSDMGGCLIIY